MAPYNSYNNYYDPVGSSSAQQQTYTYAQPASGAQYSSQAPSNYPSAYYPTYRGAHGTQQYDSNARRPAPAPVDHSASTLSNLPSQAELHFTASSLVTAATSQSDNWDGQTYAASNFTTVPPSSQATSSALYASNPSSSATFSSISGPDQSQTQSQTYAGSQTYAIGSNNRPDHTPVGTQSASSYQTMYHQSQPQAHARVQPQQQQRPSRYASPQHAVQAAETHSQNHSRQTSRDPIFHHPSPRMTANNLAHAKQREQSNMVDPSSTTVHPSQVYDDRAERQRTVQIEAARRAKLEEARAAREAAESAQKAEEERMETKRVQAANQAAKKRASEQRLAEQKAQEARDAAKTATQDKRNEQKCKAREEKKKSTTAATVLQQLGSSDAPVTGPDTNVAAPPDDDEAEMRAMFRKMREFNSRNPAMLAQMWEEERKAHVSQSSVVQQPETVPTAKQRSVANTISTSVAVSTPPATNPVATLSAAVRPPVKAATPGQSAQQGNLAIWPTHKREVVAEAATNWLKAQNANAAVAKTVTSAWVVKLLDKNPSYVQLCESFEKLGFKFERSAFARELLKVIPDGSKSQQTSAAPIIAVSNGTPQANTTKKRGRLPKDQPGKRQPGPDANVVNYTSPSFPTLIETARMINSMNTDSSLPSATFPALSQHYSGFTVLNDNTRVTNQSSNVNLEVVQKHAHPPTPPADKEEAARKRTFEDLVDLTMEESDDEGPPRKIQPPPFRSANELRHRQQSYPDGPKHSTPHYEYSHTASPLGPMVHQFVAPVLPSHPAAQPTLPNPKPPSQEQLRLERLQHERMKGRMLVEPIMRDRVARKSRYDSRTIARDVLLATGRHPDMRPLNTHLNKMQKLLSDHGGTLEGGSNKSDLSTIRWDLIDPGEPSEDARATMKSAVSQEQLADRLYDDANKEGGGRAARPVTRDGAHAIYVSSHFTAKQQHQQKYFTNSESPVRSSTTTNRPVSVGDSRDLSAKRMPTMVSPDTPVGYSAFRAAGDGVKRKGRPIGWRKNIHSREALGLVPVKPSVKAGVKSLAKSQMSNELVQPDYQTYYCQWDGCKAELHNLQILRKHVVKVHGRPNEENFYECLWQACDDRKRGVHVDRKGREKSVSTEEATFDTIECWVDHVHKQHVEKLAWKLGDGPQSDNTPHDSDAYLSDARGRSVTPVIIPQSPASQENDKFTILASDVLTSGRRTIPVGRPGKGDTNNEKQAAKELRKLGERKWLEGVVMGNEGTRLVTQKRRAGFLDDEDFEDEIEESD